MILGQLGFITGKVSNCIIIIHTIVAIICDLVCRGLTTTDKIDHMGLYVPLDAILDKPLIQIPGRVVGVIGLITILLAVGY